MSSPGSTSSSQQQQFQLSSSTSHDGELERPAVERRFEHAGTAVPGTDVDPVMSSGAGLLDLTSLWQI